MRQPRVLLTALLAACAPLSARAAAPAVSTSTPAAADACAVAAPKSLLEASAYPGHNFALGPENTATERISSGTVSLEIQFAGCYDGFEHAFVFEDAKPLASYDDRDHWLLFADEQLKALKTTALGRKDVADLERFLARAPKAVARRNAEELRLEVCRDGSPPTEDGCSKKSGGGYRFAARQLPQGHIQVYVSRYVAL